jgi:mannose-6-phosphate isomerase-like protein (cupin superfamily)
MRRVFKIAAWAVSLLLVYLIGGIVVDRYLLPADVPDLTNYFRPGDKIHSRFEGFDQTVLNVRDGWLHSRLEIAPHAAGPPEHFHENFTENFTVQTGTVSILVNGEKLTRGPGETISIPPMTPHKPFNETGETVIIESDDPRSIPVEFGYILSQLYGFMDTFPEGPPLPKMLLQLSVYGSEADSWISGGPPLSVQKAMRVAMSPTARLLGYRKYYEEYRPRR